MLTCRALWAGRALQVAWHIGPRALEAGNRLGVLSEAGQRVCEAPVDHDGDVSEAVALRILGQQTPVQLLGGLELDQRALEIANRIGEERPEAKLCARQVEHGAAVGWVALSSALGHLDRLPKRRGRPGRIAQIGTRAVAENVAKRSIADEQRLLHTARCSDRGRSGPRARESILESCRPRPRAHRRRFAPQRACCTRFPGCSGDRHQSDLVWTIVGRCPSRVRPSGPLPGNRASRRPRD